MAARIKKIYYWIAPDAEKEADGRDTWPSRTAFILACMGGAIGIGNLLRYPSVVYHNHGLQWFIPYLIALFCLGIPVLILEISIGQAYRGGPMIAYGNMNRRTMGVSLGVIMTGYVVATYYVTILAFAMRFFRSSFRSELPWVDRVEDFYMGDVIRNTEGEGGAVDGSMVTEYTTYADRGIVGETLGWTAFLWFCVWLCMFKGVGVTGRAVYFTMGLPLVMLFILLGRGVSLPNAGRGVKYYFGEWHGGKLASGQIWQAACGQIFFSIGVGFGYFTTFSSYNSRFANAVQDSVIIALSNSLYEVICAFGVFGVIGYLDMVPGDRPLGTFGVAFVTYPEAVAQMPVSQLWSVLFFITVVVLGLGSAFALIESLVTMIVDTDWGKRIPRVAVCTIVIVISFLISIIYCTEFGFYLLDAVDKWTNDISLLFVVFAEIVACTSLYRWKDVVSQVGLVSYITYNAGYIGALVLGPAIGHAVGPEAGAGVGFGIFIVGNIASLVLARSPDSIPPRLFGNNMLLTKFWWLTLYSPNQLRRDLNATVANGKNWKIPVVWGPCLRFVSAPILAIVTSFAWPNFYAEHRWDPLHIFGFTVAHICMVWIILGFVIPRAFYATFIPRDRRIDPDAYVAPQQSVITNGLAQETFGQDAGMMHERAGYDYNGDARDGVPAKPSKV